MSTKPKSSGGPVPEGEEVDDDRRSTHRCEATHDPRQQPDSNGHHPGWTRGKPNPLPQQDDRPGYQQPDGQPDQIWLEFRKYEQAERDAHEEAGGQPENGASRRP